MNLDEATIDRLRELGIADDMLTWLAHPDAVRAMLKLGPYNDADRCVACDEDAVDAHLRACPIAAAWRALGDPRGQADIERARDEAEWEDKSRERRSRMREAGLVASAAALELEETAAVQWRRYNATLAESRMMRDGETYALRPSDFVAPPTPIFFQDSPGTSGAKKPK